MAKLTLADASRVAGVARSTLYRAIQKGRLSADPDGRLDTAELLRAGYTLQRSAQQTKDEALHDAPPRNIDAQRSSAPAETQALFVLTGGAVACYWSLQEFTRDEMTLVRSLVMGSGKAMRRINDAEGISDADPIMHENARPEQTARGKAVTP